MTTNLKKALTFAAPMAIFGAMLASFATSAKADLMVPYWSARGYSAAAAQCTAPDADGKAQGKVVGHRMETVTADGNNFYIAVCERPTDGGYTYVPAWSAISTDDARNRCEYDSVTTGLAAGQSVGGAIHAVANGDDIYVVVCQRFM